MHKKVLDFAKPHINHSPVVSLLFAILNLENKHNYRYHREWLLSNFINFYINTETNEDQFFSRRNFFVDCPFIQMCVINLDQIEAICASPVVFFKECIKLGYYLYVVVKTHYISAYDKKDFVDPTFSHNMLIYGFDDTNQQFLIADHFSQGFYSTSTCTYYELENSLKEFKRVNPFYFNIVRSFRVVDTKYRFELEPIRRKIRYHLESTNLFDAHMKILPDSNYDGHTTNTYNYTSYEERKINYIFGLEVYDYLSSCLINNIFPKIRVFHLLYNHKILMLERIYLLHELGYLENYDALHAEAELLLNATQKIKLTYMKSVKFSKPKSDIFKTVKDELIAMKIAEADFLENLLRSMAK